MKTLEILDSYPSYHVEIRFDFDRSLIETVKRLPGVESRGAWNKEHRTWKVPASYLGALRELFVDEGYRVQDSRQNVVPYTYVPRKNEVLRPWQQHGVEEAMKAPGRRYIFGFTTGAGKTLTAIRFCEVLGAKRILVVCPGSVRYTWQSQLARWWPKAPHCEVIEEGRTKKLGKKAAERRDLAYMAPLQIVSYNLTSEVTVKGWDVIIFDEAHYLQSPHSKWSRVCYDISLYNPDAAVLGLTATLAPTEPLNLFGPLHVIQPDCWGKPTRTKTSYPSFTFARRYSVGYKGEYGWQFEGINEETQEELRDRLDSVMLRVTEEEIRNYIPAITFDVLRVPKKTVETVREWVEANEGPHVIFTWYREKAEQLANALQGEYVHGGHTAKQRTAIIEKTKASERVLVATMGAAGIGIDLGYASHILIAELVGRSEKIVQACGRIMGLRRSEAAYVTFLVESTEADEKRAWVLAERLQGIASGYKLGDAEQELVKLLDTKAVDARLRDLYIDMELEDLDFE